MQHGWAALIATTMPRRSEKVPSRPQPGVGWAGVGWGGRGKGGTRQQDSPVGARRDQLLPQRPQLRSPGAQLQLVPGLRRRNKA